MDSAGAPGIALTQLVQRSSRNKMFGFNIVTEGATWGRMRGQCRHQFRYGVGLGAQGAH